MVFISSRSLLRSILSFRTDVLTVENVNFIMGILTFSKNQCFRSKEGFESVLGHSRASFGSFGGVSWEFFSTSGSIIEGVHIRPGIIFGLVCLLLAVEDGSGASWCCFWVVLGVPEGLLRLVLGAPEGLSRVSIGLTDARNLVTKKKHKMRKVDLAIYNFTILFC